MRVQNANTHIRHPSHVPTVAMAQSEARTDEVKPLVSCSNRVRQASSPLKDHETHGSRVLARREDQHCWKGPWEQMLKDEWLTLS